MSWSTTSGDESVRRAILLPAACTLLAAFITANRGLAQPPSPAGPTIVLQPQGFATAVLDDPRFGGSLLPPIEPAYQEPLRQRPPPAASPTATLGPAIAIALPEGATSAPDVQSASSCRPDGKKRVQLEASWDNGLQFASTDEQFQIHLGGAGHVDSVWLIGPHSVFDAPGGSTSGVGNSTALFLRRAVLQADGSIYGQFDYSVQFDFANASNENDGLQTPSFSNLTSSPAPLNVWLQVRDVPFFGNVRFGNQVKPIGMENNTGFAFLPFMERSDNYDAFYGPFDNGYALGLTARSWSESERMTWQYGIYRPATNVFGVALNKFEYGGRVTALPEYEEDGCLLVHVGLGLWAGELVQNEMRDRARPQLRNAPGFAVPIIADTSEIPGTRQVTIAPEFAFVVGSLTFQAEWAGQFLTDAIDGTLPQGTIFYHGAYAEALYYLTGEHDEYIRREGAFGRQIPGENYHLKKCDPVCGCGAWQLGMRFDYLDLTDKAIQGGMLYDWTVGLNWYLNPNMKVQFNYILEHRDQPGVAAGWIDGIGVRAAYNF